jgi:hypothetical protein
VTAVIFDSAIFGGSQRLHDMVKFAKENIPYLLLPEKKVDHYMKVMGEEI